MVVEVVFVQREKHRKINMRKELNIFVDPQTHQSLKLKVSLLRGNHIIAGSLHGKNIAYPIINGIPRFINQSNSLDFKKSKGEKQTAASFGSKWNDFRAQNYGIGSWDYNNLKEQFIALLGCKTLVELRNIFAKAKTTLNAGCGVAWSEYLFNFNQETQRHCVDISLAVETAFKKTKQLTNVVVSQASIFELPYEDNSFDIVYSLGVIHHTSDPRKALKKLAVKLKQGGLMGVYIYNKKPFLRELADEAIRKITTKMTYKDCMSFSKKMTRLGESLSKISQPLIIKEDIALLGIKKGEYRAQRFLYDYFIKCWYGSNQDNAYADMVNQDWYHPFYASHHTKKEILGWFGECGLTNIRCIQPKGWENSGYFISGKKA